MAVKLDPTRIFLYHLRLKYKPLLNLCVHCVSYNNVSIILLINVVKKKKKKNRNKNKKKDRSKLLSLDPKQQTIEISNA